MIDMKVIEQTLEFDGGEWIYRLRETNRGVMVSRVPEDSQLWSHGIIKQIYNLTLEKFVPASNSVPDNVWFNTLAEAQEVVVKTALFGEKV